MSVGYLGAAGVLHPVTLLQLENVQVTQIKTDAKEGYTALQVGSSDQLPRRVSDPMRRHFEVLYPFPPYKSDVHLSPVPYEPDAHLSPSLTGPRCRSRASRPRRRRSSSGSRPRRCCRSARRSQRGTLSRGSTLT